MGFARSYKVAMVAACPFPCSRGTPVRIQRMAEGLVDRGHDVHVVTYHLSEPIPLAAAVQVHRIRNIPTYRYYNPGPTAQKLLFVDWFLQVALRNVLRTNDIDVIHAHHVEGLLVSLMARRIRPEIPIVFDAHTLLESELPFYAHPLLRPLLRKMGTLIDRYTSGKADHLITVTEELREQLLSLGVVGSAHSTTIGNGVELDLFIGHHWSMRSDTKRCTLVFTGNMAPYQGIETLLRAFASIQRSDILVTLRIVTQASFDDHETLCRELGIRDRIELIKAGFDKIPELLASSDIALNPRVEAPGLPQKTMNYMAAGMPIVSFAGSGQHLIDKHSALLVDGSRVEDFASAINILIDDTQLAKHLSVNAFAAVQQRDWSWAAHQVESVYDHLSPAGLFALSGTQ